MGKTVAADYMESALSIVHTRGTAYPIGTNGITLIPVNRILQNLSGAAQGIVIACLITRKVSKHRYVIGSTHRPPLG